MEAIQITYALGHPTVCIKILSLTCWCRVTRVHLTMAPVQEFWTWLLTEWNGAFQASVPTTAFRSHVLTLFAETSPTLIRGTSTRSSPQPRPPLSLFSTLISHDLYAAWLAHNQTLYPPNTPTPRDIIKDIFRTTVKHTILHIYYTNAYQTSSTDFLEESDFEEAWPAAHKNTSLSMQH
mmetsp:Transcript_10046/g.16487  ORF Transcript_10046/g.16487 Transcript_10046/m.16487 type:complete len:179 (+) Transcript_10046:396-932(+)